MVFCFNYTASNRNTHLKRTMHIGMMNTGGSVITGAPMAIYIAVELPEPEDMVTPAITSTGDEKLPAPTEVTAWICKYREKEGHQRMNRVLCTVSSYFNSVPSTRISNYSSDINASSILLLNKSHYFSIVCITDSDIVVEDDSIGRVWR